MGEGARMIFRFYTLSKAVLGPIKELSMRRKSF
jgi:hypothetical protein